MKKLLILVLTAFLCSAVFAQERPTKFKLINPKDPKEILELNLQTNEFFLFQGNDGIRGTFSVSQEKNKIQAMFSRIEGVVASTSEVPKFTPPTITFTINNGGVSRGTNHSNGLHGVFGGKNFLYDEETVALMKGPRASPNQACHANIGMLINGAIEMYNIDHESVHIDTFAEADITGKLSEYFIIKTFSKPEKTCFYSGKNLRSGEKVKCAVHGLP